MNMVSNFSLLCIISKCIWTVALNAPHIKSDGVDVVGADYSTWGADDDGSDSASDELTRAKSSVCMWS